MKIFILFFVLFFSSTSYSEIRVVFGSGSVSCPTNSFLISAYNLLRKTTQEQSSYSHNALSCSYSNSYSVWDCLNSIGYHNIGWNDLDYYYNHPKYAADMLGFCYIGDGEVITRPISGGFMYFSGLEVGCPAGYQSLATIRAWKDFFTNYTANYTITKDIGNMVSCSKNCQNKTDLVINESSGVCKSGYTIIGIGSQNTFRDNNCSFDSQVNPTKVNCPTSWFGMTWNNPVPVICAKLK